MFGSIAPPLAAIASLAMFTPLVISQGLFTAIVAAGIAGSMIVAVIIIGYTVHEFRRHEIW